LISADELIWQERNGKTTLHLGKGPALASVAPDSVYPPPRFETNQPRRSWRLIGEENLKTSTSRSTATAVNESQLLNLAARLNRAPRIPPTYPYGHPLGPSGNAPKTFGHCGGGNHSLPTNVGVRNPAQELGDAFRADLFASFQIEGRQHTTELSLNRDFKNNNRRWRRIQANGGIKKSVGRPRCTLSGEQERNARELLQGGWGINRTARALGIGNGAVSRLKSALGSS
jgi:hypothetical protein